MMFDDTLISIHAPTRGATILCNHRGLVFGFQSTLPREERQTMRKLTIAELNFNPRSHERSDRVESSLERSINISIHAPTRGATEYLGIQENPKGFQSTLPREERHMSPEELAELQEFQSTLPREERPITCSKTRDTRRISIHAPTRGATFFMALAMPYYTTISIHAPTRGATAILHKKFVYFYTIPTINI